MAQTQLSRRAFRDQVIATLGAHDLSGFVITPGDDDLQLKAARDSSVAQINLDNFYASYTSGNPLAGTVASCARQMAQIMAEQPRPDADGREQHRFDGYVSAAPLLRVQLSTRPPHPAGEHAAMLGLAADDPVEIVRPWRFGLREYLTVDNGDNLYFATAIQLRDWGQPIDALYERARAQTRDALALTGLPAVQEQAGVRLIIWDNDLPGYSCSRLLFPDLLLPPPRGGTRAIVAAPDRDLVVRLDFTADQATDAYQLASIVVSARDGRPHQLLGPRLLQLGASGTLSDPGIAAFGSRAMSDALRRDRRAANRRRPQ
jgi:hypothetical protein